MRKYKKSLFIFRRDLRLDDNTGLIAALKSSDSVIPSFIFDKRQIEGNPYRSDNLVQFLISSLKDLSAQLKQKEGRLFIFYGATEDILKGLIKEEKINAVFVNRDYTPFSRKRDEAIKAVCEKLKADFCPFSDYLLNEPQDVKKDSGSPYTIFTPFFRRASLIEIRKPQANKESNYFTGRIKDEGEAVFKKILLKENPQLAVKGGRSEALAVLKNMKKFKDYADTRNLPAVKGTTYLSAHHKFGTCSIREVYHAVRNAFGPTHALINELYWRDFFTHIGFHFPYVLGHAFNKRYENIHWDNDKVKFKAWCEGRTGFPIVDAGMRELNATGFMHNRVRMIVSSFLVKDLHIDWKWGEKYFAQKLVDYDPLVNNGNWQWAASTGCDAQPYFRIFNPWLQQERFDPDCVYVKKWVSELGKASVKDIYDLQKGKDLFSSEGDYPPMIVDHKVESIRAKAMYESAR